MIEQKLKKVSSDVREEIEDFLYEEASKIDDGRFEEWLDMMTDSCTYRMPVRLTRERSDLPDVSVDMYHFYDDRSTLQLRVDRLQTEYAWAEDPPSRTRHLVTNVRAFSVSNDEVKVNSNFLVYWNRGDSPDADLISGKRNDILRRVDGAWKLSERTIIVDQSSLGTGHLSIFL
ncbi:3-phenylpropionate/cinnamic acid dioxygenase subunit beta [Oceanobacillus sp. 143]|uniref:Aromatic-ring-hydroxylating dioxygenase subunit beta n=1 Tax=Oceanobacillus zhaokaii TaxID=2052660 RepID=A0A345PE54_9BACI|nr:aromatic-ring-hydroxylating dioxygenase subunit beta [Oceanobacillus zhaokaii]AXI08284.1 aromatic-ring-hydroxylating dioxygenase subunit beta [Oceanobacillus zhaokaii]QGS68206.1 3-phenylpropionate/cinnamic acid dioxygenase subunit beta [Oceanobacillus sp. 143]